MRNNPEHSKNFAQRWRNFEQEGKDVYGEARLVDAMAQRGSRILDAGCGTGRIGGWLSQRGHQVAGVDLDPHLIEVARTDYPEAQWQVGNLADFELRDADGALGQFDLAVCAGNVVTFFAQAERVPALSNLARHLAPAGRLVVGFGLDRGYAAQDFEADAKAAGLVLEQRFSTWELHPANDQFMVAVLARPAG